MDSNPWAIRPGWNSCTICIIFHPDRMDLVQSLVSSAIRPGWSYCSFCGNRCHPQKSCDPVPVVLPQRVSSGQILYLHSFRPPTRSTLRLKSCSPTPRGWYTISPAEQTLPHANFPTGQFVGGRVCPQESLSQESLSCRSREAHQSANIAI